VPAFTDASVVLVLGFIRKVFNCVAFAHVLWSVAPRLVFFLLMVPRRSPSSSCCRLPAH
jgi:hypothetical protein